jgi:hypothetical protein
VLPLEGRKKEDVSLCRFSCASRETRQKQWLASLMSVMGIYRQLLWNPHLLRPSKTDRQSEDAECRKFLCEWDARADPLSISGVASVRFFIR